MKLLYCKNCGDVFNLTRFKKTCSCQQSAGYYTDNLNAVKSGNCIALGFSNSTFIQAIQDEPENEPSLPFTAFVIPKNCKTIKPL